MAKTSRVRKFVLALALLSACGGHAPARDAGTHDDDDVTRADAEPDREAGENAEDADAEGGSTAPSDAAAPQDASTPNDAALEAGAASVQIATPGRSRISVWGRKVCAINEQRDVVCWGTDGSPPSSGVALHGPFRSVERCSNGYLAPVCAIAETGALTCAGWQGGASGMVDDPQDCRPRISASAFSCGSFGDSEIAVLDPQGALLRLASLCTVVPEQHDAGPYDRVEMVDDNICVLDRAHKVHCFTDARLPDGGLSPEDPVIEDTYIDLALGEIATCGVTREGRVRCWDYLGVEAAGKDSFAASASSRGVKVARLASAPEGSDVLCALFEDGSVGCSFSFEQAAIRLVSKSKPWIEIAVDRETLCGVQSDRSVDCRPVYGSCSDPDCMKLVQAIAPPDGLRVPE